MKRPEEVSGTSLGKRLQALSGLLALIFTGILYTLLDNGDHKVHFLMTRLDYDIPLLKPFIVPYLMWEPFVLGMLILLCFKDLSIYYRTLTVLVIGELISFLFFFCYQTYVPRPHLTGDDMFTNWVRFVYKHDSPFNDFPSIHVLTSYIVLKGLFKSSIQGNRIRVPLLVIGISIIFSTVFVKQHTVLDVVGGAAVAEAVFALLLRLWPDETAVKARTSVYSKSQGYGG